MSKKYQPFKFGVSTESDNDWLKGNIKPKFDLELECKMLGSKSSDISDSLWFNLAQKELAEYRATGVLNFREWMNIQASLLQWENEKSTKRNPIYIERVRLFFLETGITPPVTFSRYDIGATKLRLMGGDYNTNKMGKGAARELAYRYIASLIAIGSKKREAVLFSTVIINARYGGRNGLPKIIFNAASIARFYNQDYKKTMINRLESYEQYTKSMIEADLNLKSLWKAELTNLRATIDINVLSTHIIGSYSG